MTSRVCSKNKEKKAERKNSVKKIDQTGKKNCTKKQKACSVAWSRNRLIICTCKKLLDHGTTVTHMI